MKKNTINYFLKFDLSNRNIPIITRLMIFNGQILLINNVYYK